MFEFKDKNYEISLNIGRIKLIEAALNGRSLYGLIATTAGLLTVSDLETIFQFGLKEAGKTEYLPQDDAKKICEEYIQEKGYMPAARLVQSEMQSSVPFLYRRS